jgi:hypothetical protein|tara:strand:+ start:682 stop:942 length:261 start_codon:yes stop_codon:yes gene_type:complete
MKVYIASGNFRKVLNTDLNKKQIVIKMFLDHLTGSEILDEYVYVDERSCKDYVSSDKKTTVWETADILEECYHILKESDDEDFEEE